MSRAWGDIFRRVHMTPSLESYQQGHLHFKGPTLECRQTHLLETWQEQDNASPPSNPLPSSSQHLCDRHEILAKRDIELFQPAEAASHVYEGSAQDEREQVESLSCTLCKLLAELPAHRSDDKYGLYVVNLLNEKERQLALDYPPEHFVMGLAVSEENKIRVSRGRLGFLPPPMEGIRKEELLVPIQTEDRSPEASSSPYHARILDTEKADFGSAKAWIQECSSLHQSCGTPAAGLSGIIHVIDCVSRKILPLPAHTEYLALSYVWGPQPVSSSKSPDNSKLTQVPANVPRTITDAMAVTLELDYKYLWCDRYCIDQNDPVSKAFQLSLMDKIYEAAKVTLVAASGFDDTFGLPGAGTHPLVPRELQPQAQIGAHTVVPLGPSIETIVKESKWATRAWTFQEARLSTRCLIFSPRQLQFLCKTTSRYEALPRLPILSNYDEGTEVNIRSVFGVSAADENNSSKGTKNFQSLANELLRRDITYEFDTLNAFRGILNRLEYFSFFGVPLITREGRELHNAKLNGLVGSSASENPQLATLSDSKRIISSSTLDQSKRRHRPNIFHAGSWHHYMYDEFPGPGEPFQPSPTLAFLQGLSWIRSHNDYQALKSGNSTTIADRRRHDMPSWSWVSLLRGPIEYLNDYDSPKELSGDVLLNLHTGIQVWVQDLSKSGDEQEWISFDDAWGMNTGKVLPDFGSHIKLETLTGDVESCVVTEPRFMEKEYGYSITLPSLSSEENQEQKLDIDCASEDMLASGPGTYHDLGWKIALVLSNTFYNPDYENAWRGTEPHRIYLVLRPLNGFWRRVGVISTNDNHASDDKGIINSLKRETVILC